MTVDRSPQGALPPRWDGAVAPPQDASSPLRTEGASPGPHEGASPGPRDTGTERVVLDPAGIARATTRMAHEIRERHGDLSEVELIAIAQGGVPVARLLAERLAELCQRELAIGELDVTLYRDDVIGRGKRPVPRRTRMPASVLGRRVVLVDDVVFTGRTVRAAMDAVIDFGRPQSIQIACLIDRGHRELPIQVDFVGKNIPTARAEEVSLRRRADGQLEVSVR
jgi:pyrimidine operon attenuation protein/uracil phosphoribosyltransferase